MLCNVEQHNIEQHNVEQHNVEQYNIEQHNVEQYNIDQHNVEQHNVEVGEFGFGQLSLNLPHCAALQTDIEPRYPCTRFDEPFGLSSAAGTQLG